MSTRAALIAIFVSAAVLVVGWEAGGPAGQAGSPDPAAPAPASPVPASPSAASGNFTGSVVQTRFGNMQVEVTIRSGAITEVKAVQVTDRDGRSTAISNRAVPVLRSEVLSVQSSAVQNVSGATYTSSGYLQSLQSALDDAGY